MSYLAIDSRFDNAKEPRSESLNRRLRLFYIQLDTVYEMNPTLHVNENTAYKV